jgi:hypothetical protein
MKALFIKDIRLNIPNSKIRVFIFLAIILLAPIAFGSYMMSSAFVSFLLFLVLFLNQIVDDRTKFEEYALTLPISRAQYIRGKYIELAAVFILSVVLMLLSTVLIIAFGQAKIYGVAPHIDFFDIELRKVLGLPFILFVVPAGLMILSSLIYPIITKWGAQVGQVFIVVIIIPLPLGIMSVTDRLIDRVNRIDTVNEDNFLHSVDAKVGYGFSHAWGFVVPAVAIAAYLISYAISMRIVRDRDFN